TSYRNGLRWTLGHRWVLVTVALGAVALAAGLWPMVGKEQLPQTDSGNLTVRVKHPVGTALAVTDRTMQRVEGILESDPDVETVIIGAGMNVGLRGAGGGSANEGSASIRLKANRKANTNDVSKRLTMKLR